ncbi:MAG TPA: hypothetical protein VII11_08365 [Bacteroidota bacterium]
MKNSRTVIGLILVALLFMFQPLAMAQGQGRGFRSPEERAKQLKEQLTLTDEQTTKVLKIYEEGQKQTMDMMGSAMGDRDAMRKVMTSVTTKQDSLIEKLLTKEQLKKYDVVKKERQQRMMQRRGPGG